MIYLDYSATTPVDEEVLKAMKPYFSSIFANPASVHSLGQQALKAVDDARYSIADLLRVSGTDLIFTSGATEANNLALFGTLKKGDHLLTTPIEHASILEPAEALKNRGITVTTLPASKEGLINPRTVIDNLRPQTKLISIGYVNSEVGVIQPIKKIGRLVQKYNKQRYEEWLKQNPRKRGSKPVPVLFHTDATQAPNYLDCSPQVLHVDLMSLSAHKIYGPKGIGLLYCRSDITLTPLLFGGHQERNLRSGTVNVPGVVGFGKALERAYKHQGKYTKQISTLRQHLISRLKKTLPHVIINTPLPESTPSHLNISFPGLEGDILQALLDEQGVAVSTGSACASGDITISPVLKAMGRSEELARGAIRITLGKYTTKMEIEKIVKILKIVVQGNT